MKYYILLTFFPIYYSLIKYKSYLKKCIFYNKIDSLELELKIKFKFIGDGYDNREITDGVLTNLNFEKMYLLKKLENNVINIHTKLSLIKYYESLNTISYIANLHAGGLLDDWDFI